MAQVPAIALVARFGIYGIEIYDKNGATWPWHWYSRNYLENWRFYGLVRLP